MAFDPHANFGYSTIATAPVPALTGLSLTVAAGEGALFPAVPFNCTVWPSGVSPISTNAEIIRVTAKAGDVFTITRAQESTAAIAIAAGYQISNTITVKVITDLETAIAALPQFAVQSISAGTTLGTGPQIILSNSNGVSFGMSNNIITASVAGGGGGGGAAISAGTNSQNTGTVVFSNSNGISFGMSTNGMVTASYTVPSTAGLISALNFSAGTTSNNVSDSLVFSDANNVSFGLDGSTITANAAPMWVAAGNGSFQESTIRFFDSPSVVFSTGLLQRVSATATFKVSAGTTSNGLSALTFSDANGISFGLNASTITASHDGLTSQSNQAASASNGSFTFQTLIFSNSNNFAFGTSAGGIITLSQIAVLAQGSVSAGTTSVALGQVIFSNSNRVSFGLNGSVVTAQHALNFSGGTTSNNISDQLVFSNSNGISFGLNGSTLTASHATSLTNINLSAGTTSQNLSNFVFSNSNNVSFGLNGSTVTASATVASTQGSVVFGAVGSTNTGSQLIFSNSNNVTFGLNASTFTASVTVASTQGSLRFSAGTTNTLASNFSFSDGSNVSFGLNGSTITASVATSLTNIRVSAGTTSNNLSAMTFDNAGGITFGLNGSVITAAAPAGAPSPVNFSAGTTSNNLGSVVFSNSNGVSFGLNGSTVTASVAGGAGITALNFSAGTTSQNISNSLVFSNSNGVSFGLNGSTITGSIPAYTAYTYQNRQLGASTGMVPGQNSVWLSPFRIGAPVSASTGLHMVSLTGSVTSNQTNTVGMTLDMMLYKNTGPASQMDSIWSTSHGFTFWNSGTASVSYSHNTTSGSSAGSNLMTASVYGNRQITFSIGSTLDTGLYAWGFRQSSSSAGQSSVLRSFNAVMDSPYAQAQGFIGSATNASIGYADAGTYSATSAAMPASFLLSEIKQTVNIVPYVKFGAV